ncbi:MAG: nitrate- and nitrite sensing domain-containing protein, partial [Helicobacteraceae bacterium]|nr:nitrate- and nitrite sensing domain-containing protein [Helicobacteraceae bacterium]
MRNYLAHFHFITKLLLLTIPPILLILYLSSEKIVTIYANYYALKKTEQSVILSIQMGALVHEIQIERGMSAGYLSSHRVRFSDKLPVQRQQVDVQFNALKTLIRQFGTMSFSVKVKEACRMLDNISVVRSQVTAGSISSHNEIDLYTRIITIFLDDISNIAKNADDAALLRKLSAYSSFLEAKERIGLERAIGTEKFGEKRFDPELRTTIISLMAEQKTFLIFFFTYASDESITLYHTLVKPSSFKELAHLEQLLVNSKDAQIFDTDPEYWFAAITKKIEAFRQIHQTLASNIVTYINTRHTQMFYHLITILLLNVLMVFGIIAMATYVSKGLNKENNEQKQALIQQSKLAAMGEMISSIAHQWRQPLNAVGVLLQEIQLKYQYDRLDKEEFNSLSEEIQKYLEYMSKTIDDFRDFFKPSKEMKAFDVVQALHDALKIVDKQLENHNIELTLNVKCTDESIEDISEAFIIDGYESEFKQVIINLINNAKEAIEEHAQKVPLPHKTIQIDILRDTEDVIITITDNGEGIPAELLDTIFDPYISTKEEQQGTGLGLYMSKLIIERNMLGRLRASNTPLGA